MKPQFAHCIAFLTRFIVLGFICLLSWNGVAQPPNRGYYWTQVTAAAPWAGRAYHTAVSFKNRIWIMGGDTPNSMRDVWSSSDGREWRLEADELSWADWIGAETVVVLDNKLWLVDTWSATGAVWNSPDGVNWTRVASSIPCAHRYGCLRAVFQNKLWGLGGENWAELDPYYDVWNSSDGKDWTPVVQRFAWGALHPHGTVFQGKLWILGGTYYDQDDGTVWDHHASYSTDGAEWNSTLSPDVGYENTYVEFDNQLWDLDRGYDIYYPWDEEDFHASNEVWHSENGTTWRPVPNGPWQARTSQAAVTFNGKAWVLGGELPNGTFLNDVWSLTPILLTIDTGQGTRFRLGEEMTLTLSAGDLAGVVGYQWSKNGSPIPGATSDTYHVDHFTEKDAGAYSCQLTGDGFGSATPVQIDLLDPTMPATGTTGLVLAMAMVTGVLVFRRRLFSSHPRQRSETRQC